MGEQMTKRRPPRVLIIVENEPVLRDRRVWQECLSLTFAGYHVSVICPMADGDPPVEYLQGVAVYRYRPALGASGTMGFVYEFAYSWVRTLLLSVKVLRREGFDVIQACNPPDTFFAIVWLYKPLKKRFVYDQHDLAPETYEARFEHPSPALSWGLRLLERLTYRTADRVIATSRFGSWCTSLVLRITSRCPASSGTTSWGRTSPLPTLGSARNLGTHSTRSPRS